METCPVCNNNFYICNKTSIKNKKRLELLRFRHGEKIENIIKECKKKQNLFITSCPFCDEYIDCVKI